MCDICGDAEWLPLADSTLPSWAWSVTPCECQIKRQAERLQRICGLTESERRLTLADVSPNGPGTDEMISAARRFIAEPSGFLTLYGGSGNAKTMILQSVINACVSDGVLAIYTTFYNLISYIKEAFNENESAQRRIQQFIDARVLAIDEMDKVRATDWVIELRGALLDRRYRDAIDGASGTLFAMNSAPDSDSFMPDWLTSRLYDGRFTVIHNTDPDMRRLMR